MFFATGQRQRKYSESLRVLCNKGASKRMPAVPDVCPRGTCRVQTAFYAQVCYMERMAGAYVFIVCSAQLSSGRRHA